MVMIEFLQLSKDNMNRFLISLAKELLLLWRDRTALAVIFLMPVALVFIVTLVQENVYQETNRDTLNIGILNFDTGIMSDVIETVLMGSDDMKITRFSSESPDARKILLEKVTSGDFQAGVILEEGLSEKATAMAESKFMESESSSGLSPGNITIAFDPMLPDFFRESLKGALERHLHDMESIMAVAVLAEQFNPEPAALDLKTVLNDSDRWGPGGTVVFTIADIPENLIRKIPGSVEQNVPAWTVFGIFLLAIPLSGAFIRERYEGTLIRLKTIPSPLAFVITGKVTAYTLLALLQAPVMFAMGTTFLPLTGTEKLVLSGVYHQLFFVVLATALAAAGYGLLVGALARSYEQSSMICAVSVVVAAAIGGIMVPTYAMPDFLQTIAGLSPLNWSQDAFLLILMEKGCLRDVWNDLAALLLFASGCSTLALFRISRCG